MPLHIHIEADNAGALLADLQRLSANLLTPAASTSRVSEPAAADTAINQASQAAAAEPARTSRKKKEPTPEPVTIEGTVTVEPAAAPASDAPMMTVDDARERMKTFAKDGHLAEVEAAIAHFGVKKVSDIDADAKGKPSPKFAAFVAKIEELIAAKPTTEDNANA